MIKEATKIVKALQEKGFIAYFAGGGVRDILLQKDPKDIDIVTSAKSEEIEKMFPDHLKVGKAFGVILVKSNKYSFEIATFREEGPYKDKRRPEWFKYATEEIDAKRRDFTINGMFLDPLKNKIIDYVGGQDDLKKRVIRFIGDPEARIKEDNLRLIRAIRFKITLNFQYAPETFQSITKLSSLIKDVSPERIKEELNKILLSPRRHIGLTELSQSQITHHVLPEIENLKGVPQPIEYHHEGDVFTHTYLALKSLPENASLHLIWAVILHDIAKPQTLIREGEKIIFHDHAEVSANMAKQILKRLRFSNIEIDTVAWLIDNHMKIGQVDKMRPTKKMAFLLDPRFEDLIELCRADSMGTYPVNLSLARKLTGEMNSAKKQKEEAKKISTKTQLITGDTLIELGYNPSKEFKNIIDTVNDKIIDGELENLADAEKYVITNFKK